MVAGNADALGDLLADGFMLTHMTGYRQRKAEWLADVRVSVDVDGDAPVITARTRTEATIWGGHGIWPLRLRIRFARVGDSWLAAHTRASTWA